MAPTAQEIEAYEKLRQLEQEGKNACLMFYADWCGACKYAKQSMVPSLEAKAASANTEIVMVNVDQCPNMASETKVAAMPTFQFWKVQGSGELAFEDDLTVVGANLAKCEQALN